MRSHTNKFIQYPLTLYIFASAILLYFVFSPAVNILYYGGDDFRYAFGGWHHACVQDDGFEFMLTLGRPVQAYLDCLSFKFAYTLPRMALIRLIAVSFMGLAMGFVAEYLYSLGLSLLNAFFAAGLLFVIQQLYIDTIFTGSICLPFTLLLTLLAYKAFTQKSQRFLAGVCLLAAMLTYPAMGFFFVTLSLAKVLFTPLDRWQQTRREMVREISFFVFVSSIYFAWAYYNMHFHALTPIPEQYHLDHPNIQWLEFFTRFLFIMQLFKTHLAFPLNDLLWQAAIVLLVLVSGAAFALKHFLQTEFYLQNKQQAVTALIQGVMGALVLFLLSSGFVLVMPSIHDVEGRVLFGSIAASWIVLSWALWCFRNAFTFFLLCILFLIGGYQANKSLLYKAYNQNEMIGSVTSSIQSYFNQELNLQRIHFVIPHSVYPYNKFFIANEALQQVLGRHHYRIVWCSLPRGTLGKEQDHQAEMLNCLNTLSPHTIAITYSYPEENFQITKHMLKYDATKV